MIRPYELEETQKIADILTILEDMRKEIVNELQIIYLRMKKASEQPRVIILEERLRAIDIALDKIMEL